MAALAALAQENRQNQDAAAGIPAASAADQTDTAAPLESFDTLEDPTLFDSRAGLGYEGVQKRAGAYQNKFLLQGAYAFSTQSTNDTAVAFEQKVISQNYGDNGNGLGDLSLSAGHVFKPAGRFRWGAGLEAQFPTATSDETGDGVIKLTPILGWQMKLLNNLQFGGELKYNYSVYQEQGRAEVNSIECNPQLLAEWPHDIYTFVAWNSEWGLQSGGTYTGKFEWQIGKAFGGRHQWVSYVGAEFPWANPQGNDLCTFKAGVSYLFK